MRIITKGALTRGRRGQATMMLVAAAGLAATALTASAAAASSPPPATTGHRIEATATDGTATVPAAFIAVTPIRILDTRPAPAGPVGLVTPAKLGPGARLDLRLAGDGLIVPATASGVLINVTIDEDATLPSYLTVWPMGEVQPFTSANNAYPGLIAANSLVAKLGNGGISLFNQRGSVNVVIDLVGYIVPLESLDLPGSQLRSGSGGPTTDVGRNGDFYIDTNNHILYGPKAGGAWPVPGITLGGGASGPSGPSGPTGATGPAGPVGLAGSTGATGGTGNVGAAGSKILTGSGAPAGVLGAIGDLYIDTTAGSIYAKTGATTWTLQGSPGGLVGPTGPQGIPGGAIAALGTYNDTPNVLSTAGSAVAFPSANDITVGSSITHTANTADFVLGAGTYRVSYRVALGLAVIGQASVRLTLGGTGFGSAGSVLPSLISVGAEVSDTVLVVVSAGTAASRTLQLTNPSAVSLSLGSASLEIEKIA